MDNKSKKNTDNLKQSLNLNNQMLAKFPQLQKIENEKNNNDLKLYLNDFASKESETNVIASFPRLSEYQFVHLKYFRNIDVVHYHRK